MNNPRPSPDESTATRGKRAAAGLLASLATGLLAGCAATKPGTVQAVASVHLAPMSIARWEDYADLLQPQYPMSVATALGLALPKTFISRDDFASMTSAGLQLGFSAPSGTSTLVKTAGQAASSALTSTGVAGQTTTNGNSTTGDGSTTSSGNTGTNSTTVVSTTSGGSNSSTTQTTTSQTGAGTAPASSLPALTAPNAAALAAPAGTFQNDPMLTYAAATAIYQEVNILNNYLRDAALRRNYVPYLARVQLSLSPYAHGLPYDAYVDMSFFATCDGGETYRPAMALPLLVTDDVETGQASKLSQIARQLGLNLGGAIGNVGVQAQLANLQQQLKSLAGTDFNSLYMVTRASDNTLQVRLGAARNPDSGYAMLTQTHNVSFVLLVDARQSPNGSTCRFHPAGETKNSGATAPKVLVETYARMRNATTGAELPVDRKYIQDQAIAAIRRVRPADDTVAAGLEYKDVRAILGAMQTNQPADFARAYCVGLQLARDAADCEGRKFDTEMISAWTALSSVMRYTEFSATYMELPRSGRDGAAPASVNLATGVHPEAVFMHDDCKSAAVVQVAPVGLLTPHQIDARLLLFRAGPEPAGGLLEKDAYTTLAASSVTQAAPGGPYTIEFPSMKPFADISQIAARTAFAAACPGAAKPNVPNAPTFARAEPVRLVVREKGSERWTDEGSPASLLQAVYATVFVDAAGRPASASVAISAMSQALAASADGTGQMRLKLTLGEVDGGVLSFGGAALAQVPANATGVQSNGEPVATLNVKNGYVDVSLKGLVANQPVTFTLAGKRGDEAVATASTVVPVLARAAAGGAAKE